MITNRLAFDEYYHHFKTKDELTSIGFRWNCFYNGFVYRFPVFIHDNKVSLECYLIIFMDEDYEKKFMETVQIEVKIPNEDGFYAPFYSYNEGYRTLIEKINGRILKKLDAFGITLNKTKKR